MIRAVACVTVTSHCRDVHEQIASDVTCSALRACVRFVSTVSVYAWVDASENVCTNVYFCLYAWVGGWMRVGVYGCFFDLLATINIHVCISRKRML